MTTVAALIADTRNYIYTDSHDELNRLAAAIDADDVTVTFDFDLGGAQAGAKLSIDAEDFHVWQAPSTTSVSVQRAMNGTAAAEHDQGALVYVNAKHSAGKILLAVNAELNALSAPSAGLFAEKTVTFTYDSGTDAYDLAADVIDVLDVAFDANDGTGRWSPLDRSLWRVQRGLNTSDFASGVALIVNGWAESGRPVRVTYKAPFTTGLNDGGQDVETVTGVPATAVDVVALGAAIRLLAGSEVNRNFHDQGDTRRAEEVPPGARAQSVAGLMRLRQTRLNEEKARLYAKWPVVRR